MREPTKRITVLMDPALHVVLFDRSEMNNRSVSKEIVHLIETALAVKSEMTRETLHFLYRAGGGASSAGVEDKTG